jgi:hypothetical protein
MPWGSEKTGTRETRDQGNKGSRKQGIKETRAKGTGKPGLELVA